MFNLIQLLSQVDLEPLPKPPADSTELAKIMSVVFAIAGSLALLMLAIGGYRYIISRGDPSATAQAKNTILYSIIGLVVVMVAASVVAFVVSAA